MLIINHVLVGLISCRKAPPVARNVLSHVSTTYCCCCVNKSSPIMFTEGAALIISVSSTNANPAITKASWNKHDKAFKPKPSYRIMVNKIALIITQMVGHVPLPCPLP